MFVISKGLQAITGGIGFFIGYSWSVLKWAETNTTTPAAEQIIKGAISPGFLISFLYASLLGFFFHQLLPVSKTSTLRVAISPIVFSISTIAGAFGIWAALKFITI